VVLGGVDEESNERDDRSGLSPEPDVAAVMLGAAGSVGAALGVVVAGVPYGDALDDASGVSVAAAVGVALAKLGGADGVDGEAGVP